MANTTWQRFGLYLLLLVILIGFVGLSLVAIEAGQSTIGYVALGNGLLAATLLIAALMYGLITVMRRDDAPSAPIWVIGDDHSGKECLVDRYTDAQLDPMARPQVLPSTVLQAPTVHTQGRLRRLWNAFFPPRAPRIIIALNGAMLVSTPPAERIDLAQRLKTAIDTLQAPHQVAGVDIALTFMDQIEGYAAFSQWLMQAEKPLKLDISSNLDDQLSTYKTALSIALTTLSAETFLQLLSFFHNAPARLAPFDDFAQVFRDAPKPQNSRVFFTSSQGAERLISNPFR